MFHCSVAEMLSRISAAELTEWSAYFEWLAEQDPKKKPGKKDWTR